MNEAEVKTITSVNLNTKVITVNSPFAYKHYSAKQTYGSTLISLRCPVDLMSRNIEIKGSDDDSLDGYGAFLIFDGT